MNASDPKNLAAPPKPETEPKARSPQASTQISGEQHDWIFDEAKEAHEPTLEFTRKSAPLIPDTQTIEFIASPKRALSSQNETERSFVRWGIWILLVLILAGVGWVLFTIAPGH